MDNSPRGPLIGALFAILLGAATVILWLYRGGDHHYFLDYTTTAYKFIVELNAFEITIAGLGLTLAIYAAIGLFSYFLDGREVHVGRFAPQLTDATSAGLAITTVLTAVCAVLFAVGVVQDWGVEPMGVIIGAGFVLAAFVLAYFKQGFVGEDGRFDDREDGIPW